ncbi:hypothetical protein RJT34_03347 [Clitoria ternatea]|uniref:F-box domain-containing protein n=1 Tax=Clitoria ternatea TaxID=43366 RepID=A0AAN9KM13_CLITE
MATYIPQELINEILLRLPVKSLLRFKCVSKLWFSLISNPRFAKSHFDLAASPTHRFLLRSKHNDPQVKSFNIEVLLDDDDSDVVNLDFPKPTPVPEHRYDPRIHIWGLPLWNMGSCRGFILLSNYMGDLMVWNPSTGVCRRIPDSPSDLPAAYLNGIGYDESTDDYLVVLLGVNPLYDPNEEYDADAVTDWPTRIQFFSFKTNEWVQVDGDYPQYIDNFYEELFTGFFLNGALHWQVISKDKQVNVILAFDLKRRSLSEIPYPQDLQELIDPTTQKIYLRVMGECLTLTKFISEDDKFEFWVMKEYKVPSSWTLIHALPINIPWTSIISMCFTKNGGMLISNDQGGLAKFNDKGELLKYSEYIREEDYVNGPFHYCTYRESLLSLPHDFQQAIEDDQQ